MNKYVIASKGLKKHEKSESKVVEKKEKGMPEETAKDLKKIPDPQVNIMRSARMDFPRVKKG